jgi:DNA segregation ATPase FtsK/SpoIIIE, S-DNA-T family
MNEKNFSELIRDFFGILFVAFTLFSLLSLITYSPNDPSLNNAVTGKAKVVNLGGLVGAYIADSLVQVFGTGAFFFPLITFILGWAFIRGKQFHHWPWVLCSGVLFLISLCALSAALLDADPYFGKKVQTGGMAGSVLSAFLIHWLNKVGAVLTLSTFMFLALLGMTRLSANHFIDHVQSAFLGVGRWILQAGPAIKESFVDWREQREADRLEMEEEEEEFVSEPIIVTQSQPMIVQPMKKNAKKKVEEEYEEEEYEEYEEEDEEEFYVDDEELLADPEEGEYQIPPLSLLNDPPELEDEEGLREEILANSTILEEKLADFNVRGRVVQVLPGPVITLFEYEPAPGIKVSRILALADDLALAMRAVSLRIMAPIPGKPVVGIEIPNTRKEVVYFKDIMSSESFIESPSKLTMAIGKDNIGEPVAQDLATVPHLLMAGSTGSGKSVGMNAMICSILLNATPDEVKMIMIDPKMLELSIYDGIPHLIAPVVTNPKKAAAALQWAVTEMETRYKLMSEAGVRNITGYNNYVEKLEEEYEEKILEAEKQRRKAKAAGEYDEDDDEEIPEPPARLPYIVVLIDELADLMMVAGKGVEECLTRLAQMARAAGIHLIVATQRPSVDVLTGIIKANFPARISYKVISRVDSRTILDCMGADKLLGKGDMLFLPPGTSSLKRIHGCMVSDEEINRIVNFTKKQRAPDYEDSEEDIFDAIAIEEDDAEADDAEEFDEKYDEAVALVAKERQASISYIQRRMRIGYNRAARMVECMEREGVVGPSDGVRPREVYVKPIMFEE